MYRSPSESRMFSHRALGRELAAHVTPLTFNDSGAIVVVDDNREAGAPKVAEAIALLHEALRLLTELDVAGLDRQDRLDLSHELARGRIRMDAIRSGVLAEVAAKKDWEDGPTRTLVELEERVSQEPRRESQQNIARARGLAEDLPLFREAYLAGRVGAQYIDLVRSAIRSPKLKAQLADPVEGEAFLLEAAQSCSPLRTGSRASATILNRLGAMLTW